MQFLAAVALLSISLIYTLKSLFNESRFNEIPRFVREVKQVRSKCAKFIARPYKYRSLYFKNYGRQKMGKTDGTNVVQNA